MVYERTLIPALAREVGDTDTSNLYYSTDQLFSAINDGLADYNEEAFQQYTVVGSGDTAYFSPDPDADDQRLIVLYSARVLMRGELAKQARQAIVHTNPAGRTDLSQRPEWTDKIIARYDREISRLRRQRSRRLVEESLEDDGSMELKNSADAQAEGLPITTITHTT